MNYSDIFKITPGDEVPDGRSYPVNATARVDLDLRDAKGNSITGREISKGDELTVIDVGYSRQLALVQYPAGGTIRQGYATATFIDYKNEGNYYNGSTSEPVINYDGSSLGSLNPYETATKLFEVNGLTQVVYSTDKGPNTKSGFVRYAGGSPNVVHVDIPYPNVTNAQMIQYGTSGKGRALRAYKMGNGRNSFIFNCAIHGWEDHWSADGIELTKIGNQIIDYFQSHSTGDFTLYVIPAANPDGLSEGWTNNGPGRCCIKDAVDCNRDFPVGFSAGGAPRNHSGSYALSVPESKELADFIRGVKSNTSGETFLIDMHGWEGSMVGDSKIGRHFTGRLGLVQKGFGNPRGFLVQWSNSIGITSSIMELPTSIYSHADVVNLNCAGKIIDGLTEIMGATSGGDVIGDLKIGSRGEAVKDLQSKLAYVGLPVSIDGVFGEETAKYVKEFQKVHGLYVDGIVGNQTMAKLNEEVKEFEGIHHTKPTEEEKNNEKKIFLQKQNQIYKTIAGLLGFRGEAINDLGYRIVELEVPPIIIKISAEIGTSILKTSESGYPTLNISGGKFNVFGNLPGNITAYLGEKQLQEVAYNINNGAITFSVTNNSELKVYFNSVYKCADDTIEFGNSLILTMSVLPVKPSNGNLSNAFVLDWQEILGEFKVREQPVYTQAQEKAGIVLGAMALGLIIVPILPEVGVAITGVAAASIGTTIVTVIDKFKEMIVSIF